MSNYPSQSLSLPPAKRHSNILRSFFYMFTGKISQNANYDKGNFLSGQISIENLKNLIISDIFERFDVASDLPVFFVLSNKYFIPYLLTHFNL